MHVMIARSMPLTLLSAERHYALFVPVRLGVLKCQPSIFLLATA